MSYFTLIFTYIFFPLQIFRETKECEIQNLLRAKRELENKLSKVAHGYIPDDLDMNSREDLDENAGMT